MFSLENQIAPFIEEDFNAEDAAQRFFALYGETEITRKLNEMNSIQQSIETILRQKVRSNYGMFLLANEEINQVDEELADLRHLITNTQRLIDDVQSDRNRIAESGAVMRMNSILPELASKLAEELAGGGGGGGFGGESGMGGAGTAYTDGTGAARFDASTQKGRTAEPAVDSSASNLPGWLVRAPDDLAQFIVEQQYAKAVMIVLKTRAYLETITSTIYSSAAPADSTSQQQHQQQQGSREQWQRQRQKSWDADEDSSSRRVGGGFELSRSNSFSGRDSSDATSGGGAGGGGGGSGRSPALPPSGNSGYNAKLAELVNKINGRSAHLAAAIRKSLLSLPNSQLWGVTEQHKLLKLLIALEEFSIAAEGFSVTKVNAIRKVLHSVDPSGDSVAYAIELSRSFFLILLDACRSFQQLFETHYQRPEIKNLLLCWIQKQVAVFTSTLSKQIHTGMCEISALIVEQMRRVGVEQVNNFMSPDGTAAGAVAQQASSAIEQQEQRNGSLIASVEALLVSEELYGRGSLSFTSCCLDAAFSAARLLDAQGLQGSVCLGWLLVPEVQSMVKAYADTFISKTGPQVRQETWTPVRLQTLAVRRPGTLHEQSFAHGANTATTAAGGTGTTTAAHLQRPTQLTHTRTEANAAEAAAGEDGAVAQSYEWVLTVINHFCEEVWILLQAQQQSVEHCGVIGGGADGEGPISSNASSVASMIAPANLSPGGLGSSNNTPNAAFKAAPTNTLLNRHVDFNRSMISLMSSSHITTGGNGGRKGDDEEEAAEAAAEAAAAELWHQRHMQELHMVQDQLMQASYGRADVCEVEPTAVACVLRILLRYVVEVEGTDTSGLTRQQLGCFIATLKAIMEHLLPSLQHVISHCFFTESVHQRSASAQNVFKTLHPRLKRLIRDKEAERSGM